MNPVLYPAIDLLDGRAVRLHRGERESAKVYAEDPAAQAREFVQQGAQALHVVVACDADLNLELSKAIQPHQARYQE